MANRIELTFIINISDKDLDNIVEIAAASIPHWADNINNNPEKGELSFHDRIDNADYTLTYGGILEGIEEYLENPTDGDFLEFVDHQLRIDLSQINNEIADAIIQYSLFHSVFYKQGVRI